MSSLKHNLLLGSKSTRRQELLKACNLPFSIVHINVEESYPENIDRYDVPVFLSQKKSSGYAYPLAINQILITSDTVVIHNEQILGKPKSESEAFNMLLSYSDSFHDVTSGVTLRSTNKEISFSSTTRVYFNTISKKDIEFYIKNYQPFDKAGSYGIQEYFGHAHIKKIEGSYNNVVGLPTHDLLQKLKEFK